MLDVRDEDDDLACPLRGNSSPAAGLQPNSALGLSNPRVARAWIRSSVTTNGSQTVCGGGIEAHSIFSSSKPTNLDLNTTRLLVHMRGRGVWRT
jgi:hypothetical protein